MVSKKITWTTANNFYLGHLIYCACVNTPNLKKMMKNCFKWSVIAFL